MGDVVMPRLSDSMEEGTIVRWLKAEGDEVSRGDDLVEIETDKATMAHEADDDGVLVIVAGAGATLPVGATIATVGRPTRREATDPGAGADPGGGAASPVARRTAVRLGVDVQAVAGTGPGGRVLKRDVVAAASRLTPEPILPGDPPVEASLVVAAPPNASAGRPSLGEVTGERVALSGIQRTVARRMAESKQTVPDFALQVDVDMRAALALREQLRALSDPSPSVNDVIVKATAWALRRHPRLNAAFREDHVERFGPVNVGIAVATDSGLLVPTLFDADRQPLGLLAAEARRLAGRARSGDLRPEDMSGATFTISNLGMLGVDRFAGIVNPPQAAILCVGAIGRRPIVDADDAIVAAPCLTLTLVCDHRALDGADGARFLDELRSALEQPLTILT